jgi:hypothetical protein
LAAHVGLQTPSTQARAVVPVALHTTPHPPQSFGSSVSVVSQASAGLPLQSAVPLAHAGGPASGAEGSVPPPSRSGAEGSVPPPSFAAVPAFAEVPPLAFVDPAFPSPRASPSGASPSSDGFPPLACVDWLLPPVSDGACVAVALPPPALTEPPEPPEPSARALLGAVHVAVSWQSGASAEQAVDSASNVKAATTVPTRYVAKRWKSS